MRNLILFFLTVSLVSFSVCTAQQVQQPDPKTSQQASPSAISADTKQAEERPKEQPIKADATKPNEQGVNPTAPTLEKGSSAASSTQTATTQLNSSTQGITTVSTQDAKPTALPETKTNKTEIDNKVPTEKEPVTQKTPEPVVPNKETMSNETKPAETAGKPVNDTKTDDKEKSDVTTPKVEAAKAVEVPEDKQVLTTRAFDGASFVGGIVLTLGLLAISFVGFKYYKNLTKENYHIL